MKQLSFLSIFIILSLCLSAQSNIDLLILQKDYDKALKLIDFRLEKQQTAKLYLKKSTVLQKQVKFPEALDALNAGIQLDPINIDLFEERAEVNLALGNLTNGIKDYTKALSLKPNDLMLKYNLGKAYIRVTEYDKAHAIFEEIYQLDSTNIMFNKYHALAAYKANKNNRAIYLYENYINVNPNDMSAYLNLAGAYKNKRRFELENFTLGRAYRKFPDNRAIHLKYANSLLTNKNYRYGIDVYHDYMQKHDSTVMVLMNYGICLYHEKRYDEALEALENCYADAPNDVYINFYLGVTHKYLKNYDLASKYLDFAIYTSIPEFHPEMYHHLAQVYGNMREFQKSIDCYKKAFELDDRKVEVLFEIATTYEEFNFNKTMALNYYRDYLKEAGEDAQNANYALERIEKIKEDLFFEN